MKFNLKLVFSLIIVFFIYIFIYFNLNSTITVLKIENENKTKDLIPIAVVVCGINRVDESLVMIKSALIFNTENYLLNFVIIAEDQLHEVINERLKNFKTFKNFTHEILSLKFPQKNQEIWKKLFKPCASQRLFLPSLLPHVDSLIYVDCDVLFISSPHKLYNHFKSFNHDQISALALESENRNTGWYTRFARHPYFGLGLNSGVMLMNMTRMRKIKFEEKIEPIYEKWKNQLVWGDQDILNIYFHNNPNEVHLMKCEYNYRPDHCMYTSNCDLSEGSVKIVHGNRGYFHKEGKQRIFREIYMAIDEYKFNDDPCTNLIKVIEERVDEAEISNCNEMINKFLYIPKKTFCRHTNEIS
ncbi:hypothetical protein PVAND_014374 [Polypedilum vanderplanki]|uniref:UDP-D-xylose:beta-D-glucoside alpha-1,3-D-xylosyltransferase n=1 Tax=Polypedilum vanderplanki TaxID=319348 RepID=A0A9J6B9Z7_POLVA|nr:hypothetical protein PVAND_014374 [Polypedilum vanderplanki]